MDIFLQAAASQKINDFTFRNGDFYIFQDNGKKETKIKAILQAEIYTLSDKLRTEADDDDKKTSDFEVALKSTLMDLKNSSVISAATKAEIEKWEKQKGKEKK
jgi:hypothetical protein